MRRELLAPHDVVFCCWLLNLVEQFGGAMAVQVTGRTGSFFRVRKEVHQTSSASQTKGATFGAAASSCLPLVTHGLVFFAWCFHTVAA